MAQALELRKLFNEFEQHLQNGRSIPFIDSNQRIDRNFFLKFNRMSRLISSTASQCVGRTVDPTLYSMLCNANVGSSSSAALPQPEILAVSNVETTSTAVQPDVAEKFAIQNSEELKKEKKKIKSTLGVKDTLERLQYIRDNYKLFREFWALGLGALTGSVADKPERDWFKQVVRPILRCFELCCGSDVEVFLAKLTASQKTQYTKRVNGRDLLYISKFKHARCPCSNNCTTCYAQV